MTDKEFLVDLKNDIDYSLQNCFDKYQYHIALELLSEKIDMYFSNKWPVLEEK